MKSIRIANKKIGGARTFIIGEAGGNHNGNLELAKKHILIAKRSGLDAVKFQTYSAEKLVTKKAPKYWDLGDDKRTQFETFSSLDALAVKDYRELIEYAQKLKIIFFSTPFDLEAVDLLESIGVPAYKIASGDITFHDLLKKVAKTRKPIILSTGASNIEEIKEAVSIIRGSSDSDLALLHCILSYPTKFSDANLRMINSLQKIFPDIPIGFSDHTFGPLTPALAVSMGAKVVEKHFTVDKNLPNSPDHKLGLDPDDLRIMVKNVRIAEKTVMGSTIRPKSEESALRLARRSLVATKYIKRGEIIKKSMITFKRPGTGISPKFIGKVIGKKAKKNISPDTVITWNYV